MTREEILAGAYKCFFEAMKKGWAAGVKAVPVPGMPGYKEIEFQMGDFRLLDRYCVSDAGSAGTKTIWYQDKPVWFMSYGGHYPKEVIPFLKHALMLNYECCQFNGGRGPKSFREHHLYPDMIYQNNANFGSTFEGFKGVEIVIAVGRPPLGQHEYFGMALI